MQSTQVYDEVRGYDIWYTHNKITERTIAFHDSRGAQCAYNERPMTDSELAFARSPIQVLETSTNCGGVSKCIYKARDLARCAKMQSLGGACSSAALGRDDYCCPGLTSITMM
jgi:hypothetical protein